MDHRTAIRRHGGCPGRQAGLILKAFADGADSKNAYVVVNSPEDVPVPRCQNGHQLFSCSFNRFNPQNRSELK